MLNLIYMQTHVCVAWISLGDGDGRHSQVITSTMDLL